MSQSNEGIELDAYFADSLASDGNCWLSGVGRHTDSRLDLRWLASMCCMWHALRARRVPRLERRLELAENAGHDVVVLLNRPASRRQSVESVALA